MKRENKKLLLYLLINSVILITIYFLLTQQLQFLYTPMIYLLAAAGLGLWFVIYNRGFVGRNATPDMLPDDMTPENKTAFLEDCKNRLHKSRWVITLLFPLVLALALDIIAIYLIPQLQELFQ